MKWSVGLAAFLFSIGLCWSQTDHLRIGAGDLVHVRVLGSPELEQVARVSDSGFYPLLLGGNLKVAGLTPDQAARAVENALKQGRYLNDPHAGVTVDQFATENVSVMGEVRNPGNYPLVTPRSLLDVLAMAGSVTNMADRSITIERRSTGERLEYFLSNDSKVALSSAPEVFPGDIVVVPKTDVVYVLGDVPRPGGYAMSTNDSRLSVLQVISLAGSTMPSAVPSRARLIRKMPDGNYVETPLPLSAMQKGKKPDMQLQANDIVYVPFSYIRNMGTGLAGLVSSATTASIYRY